MVLKHAAELRRGQGARWLAPAENPFGVSALDLRDAALPFTLWSACRQRADEHLLRQRQDGEDLRGRSPQRAATLRCPPLRYPVAAPAPLREGPLIRPEAPEDLWFLYHFDGVLLGYHWIDRALVFRAPFTWNERALVVHAFAMDRAYFRRDRPSRGRLPHGVCDSEALFAVRLFDAVLKTYLFARAVPVPIPPWRAREPDVDGYVSEGSGIPPWRARRQSEQVMLFDPEPLSRPEAPKALQDITAAVLALFGRRALLATFDETLSLPWLDVDLGPFPALSSPQTQAAGGTP